LERWDLISHEIVRRHEQGLKEVSVPDLEIQIGRSRAELEDWISKAEGFLTKMTSEGVMFSDEEMKELQVRNYNQNGKILIFVMTEFQQFSFVLDFRI